jgi:outer membrane receptor for Fe3+-dicitrate
VPLVTLVNLTTMDRDIQNAYSEQANVEVEHQLHEGSTVSVGYQYVNGHNLIMSVNQNVPACVAVGNNNGCRPNSSYGNNSQYSSVARSNYHGLHVSFVQRPMPWGHFRVSYTYSQSMNNVGEAFFSSPIDPYDLSKDWGRSDDDQRHRLVFNAAVHSSMEPGSTVFQKITNGFQLSTMLQAYSALPLNITSGVTTVQGTAGRPMVDGQFITRNAGKGSDYFGINMRLSRSFGLGAGKQLEGAVEVFNVTNRTNILTRNANFGAGAYPAKPSSTFGQTTGVGDPRVAQLALRLKF